ncbi:10533_t:CDS:2 [Funneliformis caledonium]|uniref:10533_t:CDS:1 n=1 Tax=Funneliformis caledonium TaxID=1117310 RepID=A0A9N8VCQ4_9GLOM|nr:10533_t:CDS:2 [Funneliformis caledonium]
MSNTPFLGHTTIYARPISRIALILTKKKMESDGVSFGRNGTHPGYPRITNKENKLESTLKKLMINTNNLENL